MSKNEHQKLKESLRIFDFGSDSESGEEGEESEEGEGVLSVKKQIKLKAPPPVAKVTGVKTESEEKKQKQSTTNFR